MSMLRRPPQLDEVADTAAFLASDRAGAITAAHRQHDLRPGPGMSATCHGSRRSPPGPSAPPRAARALLPHARVLPRGRGRWCRRRSCAPGGAARPRARRRAPRLALPDRHQRVPRRPPARGRRPSADRSLARDALAAALPRPPARRGRAGEEEPDAVVVARETIELAYLALIQQLPPRQRAVCSCATCSTGRRPRPPRRSTSASRPSTARCSGRARRCSSSGPRDRRETGARPELERDRADAAATASSTRTSAPTPTPRWR